MDKAKQSYESIQEFLIDNGYPIKNNGRYIQIPALWRGGSDPTSVVVYPGDGIVKDFVTAETFTITDLIQKISGESIDKIEDKFGEGVLVRKPISKDDIKNETIFNGAILDEIKPDYSFYKGKGIKEETLKMLKSGACSEWKMKNRYVFPILDHDNRLLGLAGRAMVNSNIKWKLLGEKEKWVYPSFITDAEISRTRHVWLVESIGDFLALYDNGIKHVIVLFGVSISNAVVSYLLSKDPRQIYIALNNDEKTNEAGNNAAVRVFRRLNRYFDSENLKIHLPPADKKDWFNYYYAKG